MISKSIRTFIILFFLLIIFKMHSQVNIMGKPGYMTTPSAAWLEDRPLGITFSYVPNEYSLFENPNTENTIIFYNVRATFTSFMEVNLSIAHRPQIADKIGVGDRQLDFRFRLLKENKFWPSIVLGLTPPGSRLPILAHDYLVATKHLETSVGNFSSSLGYGSTFVFTRNPRQDNSFWKSLEIRDKMETYGNKYLYGFFGAIKYEPVDFAGIMLEYDTQTINAGLFVKYKDWLYFQAYTFEGKELAFTTSINLSLDFSPNTLRKYAKKLD